MKLDISMQNNTIELNKESKNLCAIMIPYEKFKYTCLPMVLKCFPNVAQAAMKKRPVPH
jgi:hypothetical protein